MQTASYAQLDETLHIETLENGLRVCLLPRAGVQKTFGVLAADFGAADTAFLAGSGSIKTEVPLGTAHFLEHKLFDNQAYSVHAAFAKLGAETNAFTSHVETAYEFSAAEHPYDCAGLLLDFVQLPNFTEKTVEQEKGIIEQEALMYLDQADRQLYLGTLTALFREHPVRHEALGTIQSVYSTTKKHLDLCHELFYHPENMVLFIGGGFDASRMMEKVRDNQQAKKFSRRPSVWKMKPAEPETAAQEEHVFHMSVSRPKCMVGIKEYGTAISAEDLQNRLLLTRLVLGCLFSRSGAYYKILLEEELIDYSFQYQNVSDRDFGYTLISSTTDSPHDFAGKVKQLLLDARTVELPEEDFIRQQKKLIGGFLRNLNSIETIAQQQPWYLNHGLDYLRQIEVVQQLTVHDARRFLNDWISEDRLGVCMILPG